MRIQVNAATGGYANISGVQHRRPDAPSPPWCPRLPGDGTVYRLVARHSGKVADVDGSGTANGTDIHAVALERPANQKWTFITTGDGYYKIRGVGSGKLMEVAGLSRADGGNVGIWADANAPQQHWAVTPTGDGYYFLTNRLSGLPSTSTNAATANGANIDQWTYTGQPNASGRSSPCETSVSRHFLGGRTHAVRPPRAAPRGVRRCSTVHRDALTSALSSRGESGSPERRCSLSHCSVLLTCSSAAAWLRAASRVDSALKIASCSARVRPAASVSTRPRQMRARRVRPEIPSRRVRRVSLPVAETDGAVEGRVVGVELFDVVAGLAHGVQVPLHLGQLSVGDPGGGEGRGDRFEEPPYLHEVLQGGRVALQQLHRSAEPLQEQARLQAGHIRAVAPPHLQDARDGQRLDRFAGPACARSTARSAALVSWRAGSITTLWRATR